MAYKTKACKFYQQNKCTKGDKCRYMHENEKNILMRNRINVPISTNTNESELLKNIKVYTWTSYPKKTNYEIHGHYQFDIWLYFNIIKEMYPENPYFTKHFPIVIYNNSEFDIEYTLLVTRLSTTS